MGTQRGVYGSLWCAIVFVRFVLAVRCTAISHCSVYAADGRKLVKSEKQIYCNEKETTTATTDSELYLRITQTRILYVIIIYWFNSPRYYVAQAAIWLICGGDGGLSSSSMV